MFREDLQTQKPKEKKFGNSISRCFSFSRKRKSTFIGTGTKKASFLSLPTELLALIFSFQSLRHVHVVGLSICRVVSQCLRKNGNSWPIVYRSWFLDHEDVLPIRFHGNRLQQVWLGSTTDEVIEILQTSQTLTRFGTSFCSLKQKKYSELTFLKELNLKSLSCINHCLSDFACPQLIRLSYYCSTQKEKNEEGKQKTESLFSRLEELTTNNLEAYKLFTDLKRSGAEQLWQNLKHLGVFGNVDSIFQSLLLNSLVGAPLASLNFNLNFGEATESDLQNFKNFNLARFCTQASSLENQNGRPSVFSLTRGLICLELKNLEEEHHHLLTCLENLNCLEVLFLDFRKIWVQHELIQINLGKLVLKKLKLLNLQQQRVNVKLQYVDFLLFKNAKRLCKLPICNTAKTIQLENAVRLNLKLETGNRIQLRQLQQLNLINSVDLISEKVLKCLKNSSKLRFLSISWKERFGGDEYFYQQKIKTQMKRTCKKLGIFLSLHYSRAPNFS